MKESVLVVGDVFVERFYDGIQKPEAGNVLSVVSSAHRPGGAANLAMNIVGLDYKVHLVTVLSGDEDDEGTVLLKEMLKSYQKKIKLHAYHLNDFKVPVRTHIQDLNMNPILRLDEEGVNLHWEANEAHKAVRDRSLMLLAGEWGKGRIPAAVILADYGYGIFCNKESTACIIEKTRSVGVPCISAPMHPLQDFRGSTVIVSHPSAIYESVDSEGSDDFDVVMSVVASELIPDTTHILLKRYGGGCTLHTFEDGEITDRIPSYPRDWLATESDKDALSAVLAVELVKKSSQDIDRHSLLDAATKANVAACVAKAHPQGVISIWEYNAALEEAGLNDKQKETGSDILAELRKMPEFTGRYVLCLMDHVDNMTQVEFLRRARREGDYLVVALFGEGLTPYNDRLHYLCSLNTVDYVVRYESPQDIDQIVDDLKPYALVYQQQYKDTNPPGVLTVESQGGRVVYLE